MALLTSSDKFVAFWAPRLGEAAARMRWRSFVLLLRGYLLNFAWIPLVIAGAKVPSDLLLAAGIAVAVIEAVLILLSGWQLRAANRMTSDLLGLKLGFGHINPPPREREHYEQWCHRHGIVPYAAAQAVLGRDANNQPRS